MKYQLGAGAIALLLLASCRTAGDTRTAAVPHDLTVIHMSDTHIGPYLVAKDSYTGERGHETFDFLRATIKEPYGISGAAVPHGEAPASLIINTGDVTEYGFAGETLAAVDTYESGLDLPILWVPGNHDNTWVSRPDVFRDRFGGMRYHKVVNGVHFIGINSATLQEPVQSIGEEEVLFIADIATKIPRNQPIFLMLHHPPSNDGWSSEYDLGRLMEPLRDHNVSALLVGHHHAAKAERWSGYDVIHGGSTFSKAAAENPVDGFGTLRVTNLPGDTQQAIWQATYRRKGEAKARQSHPVRILYPATKSALHAPVVKLVGKDLKLRVQVLGAPQEFAITIDGAEPIKPQVPEGFGSEKGPQPFEMIIPAGGLKNGRHWGRITAKFAEGETTERFFEFALDREDVAEQGEAEWRIKLGGGVKSAPLLVDDELFVGTNAATLVCIDTEEGEIEWTVKADGEILGSPVADGSNVLAATASGSLLVVDRESGRVVRTVKVTDGRPLYATPLLTDDLILLGGADADLYALDRRTLEQKWVNGEADQAIESAPLLVGSSLVYTAWDGYIHAANLSDGTALWKAASPKSQERLVRYYGPADYTPILHGDRIYTTDRGYLSGVYTLDGTFERTFIDGCTALAPTADGTAFLARRLSSPVARVNPDGSMAWESAVKGGRFPTAPVEKDGVVYVVDGKGCLYALDAGTGATRWSYQVTPGLFVLAAPVVDDEYVYCVGMDGVLTAIEKPE